MMQRLYDKEDERAITCGLEGDCSCCCPNVSQLVTSQALAFFVTSGNYGNDFGSSEPLVFEKCESDWVCVIFLPKCFFLICGRATNDIAT